MKNLKSTEPIYLDKKYGWCSDIYEGEKSSFKTDICTVWGSTKEELNHRVTMIKKAYEMHEALKKAMNYLPGGMPTTDLVYSLLKELEP